MNDSYAYNILYNSLSVRLCSVRFSYKICWINNIFFGKIIFHRSLRPITYASLSLSHSLRLCAVRIFRIYENVAVASADAAAITNIFSSVFMLSLNFIHNHLQSSNWKPANQHQSNQPRYMLLLVLLKEVCRISYSFRSIN